MNRINGGFKFFIAFLFVAPCSTNFAMDQEGEPYSKHNDPLYEKYCILQDSINDDYGKAIKEKISNLSAADKKLFWSYLTDSTCSEPPVSIKKYYNTLKSNKNRMVHIVKSPQTLLHCAVQLKSNDLLLLLLAVKPNILNAHSSSGRNTPLHLACRNLDLQKIKLLVWVGADISSVNKDGQTPMDIVQKIADSDSKIAEITAFLEYEQRPRVRCVAWGSGKNKYTYFS